VKRGLSRRVRLTGYLPRSEYWQLLANSDIVMVLTTLEDCLTCGAYEATALGRAMVLSDTQAMRSYFHKGAVYTAPYAEAIAQAMRNAIERKQALECETEELREDLVSKWSSTRARLEETLSDVEVPARGMRDG